jgi:hypothetical protein
MIERHYVTPAASALDANVGLRRTPILVLYATGAAAADWRATLGRDIA